jgi:hypothetical protein
MEIYGRATASKDRQLVSLEGWSHYDLYDKPEPVGIALKQAIPFFAFCPAGLEESGESAPRSTLAV